MPRHRNYIYNPEEPLVSQTTKGQKGDTGKRGIDGQKGARGPQGVKGTDGHTSTIVGSFSTNNGQSLPKNGTLPVGWDDGINPPTPFTLEVGESLIDTRTGELWCFTPASNIANWTKIGKISGPAGVNGKQGPHGDKGDRGESGANGINGENGDKGLQGDKGESGSKGDEGQKGQRGDNGRNGTNGTNGSKGDKGDEGPTGRPGLDASKGEEGRKGEKGDPGATGSPGPRGTQGPRGHKGEPASSNLLPRAGATANVSNGGLFDRHNVSKTELIDKGQIRLFFAKPEPDARYTTIVTADSAGFSADLSVCVTQKTTNFIDIAVKNRLTGEFATSGSVSFILFRFNS